MFKWLDKNFVKPIEDSRMPLGVFFLFAYGYMIVRNLLEGVLEGPGIGLATTNIVTLEMILLHFPLFYFMLFFLVAILFKLVSGVGFQKFLKVLLVYSFLIIVAPLVDPLFRAGGYDLAYPGDPRMIIQGIKAVFGLAEPYSGGSPGMIIEGWLGFILTALYAVLRGKNTGRKILSIILAPAIFMGAVFTSGGIQMAFGALFSFKGQSVMANLANIYNTGGLINSPTRKYALVLLIPIIAVFFVVMALYNWKKVKQLLKSIEPLPLVLSGLAAGAGFFLGWLHLRDVLTGVPGNPFDYLAIPTLVILGLFIALTRTFMHRATESGVQPDEKRTFKMAAGGTAILSILLAWTLGYPTLFMALFSMVVILILEVRPLRLSRMIVPAGLLKGLLVFTMVLSGFSLFGMERTFNIFPVQWIAAIFLPLCGIFLIIEWLSAKKLEGKKA